MTESCKKPYICTVFHTEACVGTFRGVVNRHNRKRRLLDVLSLAIQNFATFDLQPRDKATVDVCGVCLYPTSCASSRWGVGGYVIHIGVGFCVARSGYSGQCEGLESRDE